MTGVERVLAESRVQGESVALATVLAGPKAGSQLLVWSAGHTYGDLGWPRLNQRVALYCEQLFEAKSEASTKRFEVPGGEVEVQVELLRPA